MIFENQIAQLRNHGKLFHPHHNNALARQIYFYDRYLRSDCGLVIPASHLSPDADEELIQKGLIPSGPFLESSPSSKVLRSKNFPDLFLLLSSNQASPFLSGDLYRLGSSVLRVYLKTLTSESN